MGKLMKCKVLPKKTKMKHLLIILCCLIIPLKITISQSEYGESYEDSYEYYEEPTDSDYYYGDYGEDSESEEESTEDPYPSRSSYPVVQPYPDNSRRNQYNPRPSPTTPSSIRYRQPTLLTTQPNLNIRGYEDGWVEGDRRNQIRTTTKRPVYSPTYPSYRRTRRPRPTTPRPVTEKSTESENLDGKYGSQTGLDSKSGGNEGSENTANGQEYGNLLPYLGYREEDRSCPEGWVMDIYGYCRERFLMERRDWDWWTNIRNFYYSNRHSNQQREAYLQSYK